MSRKRKNKETLRNCRKKRDIERYHNKKSSFWQEEKERREWQTEIRKFEKNIRMGFTYPCTCCGRLCQKRNLTLLEKSSFDKTLIQENIASKVFCLNNNQYFCRTCLISVKRQAIPKLCLKNGLTFPVIDSSIAKLNRMEDRLISPTQLFQTIWPVRGPTGQYFTKGSIVHVPCCFQNTVSMIPRNFQDSNIIHIRLAKKLEYKTDYLTGWARPQKIYDAARSIITKPLFQDLGITLNRDFFTFSEDPPDSNDSDIDDYENFFMTDVEETLIVNETGIRIAPAEGYKPQSILLDKDVDFLAFPKIFGGFKMEPKSNGKPLSYGNLAKSMVMSYDNRVRERPDYILFLAKKLQLLRLQSNMNVCLRKKSLTPNVPITSANMLTNSFVEGLVQHDDGYKILRGIRSSGAHWQQEKYKVIAMIRQFGLPTFFLTVSAADTKWPELLVQLSENVARCSITEQEAANLNYREIATLIQSDPVTCVLHFNNRFRALKRTWNHKFGPFSGHKILHSYFRVEFQKRGSPHVHMLLWLRDAPIFHQNEKLSDGAVCDFIDKLISCSSKEIDQNLADLQKHNHTQSCRKRRMPNQCRFGIPYYPIDQTRILRPLKETVPEDDKKSLKKIASTISKRKEDPLSLEMTFDAFLEVCGIDFGLYVYAIRSTLNKPSVFLRRDPADMYTNAYCIKILSLMRSNMDIQFILDPFGVACYIIDYINKSDRGMSVLMKRALQEIKEGNFGLKDAFKKITNTFYNNSELCVQEATYDILQLPLSESSEECVFISTNPPHERVRMVKSQIELKQQDPNSIDIFVPNIFDHYENRPNCLKNVCLADFASDFTFTYKATTDELKMKNGNGYLSLRTRPRVIRFRNYSFNIDPEEYLREQITLFMPWEDETEDIMKKDYGTTYQENMDLIALNRKRYFKMNNDEITVAIEEALHVGTFNQIGEENSDEENTFVQEKLNNETDDFRFVDVHKEITDIGRSQNIEFFKTPTVCSEQTYQQLFEILNPNQRDYITHVGSLFRENILPFYHLVTGGAGVGKSLLVKVLYQTVYRILNKDIHSNPDQLYVLICAPTGVAAFLIEGQTIHSLFRLPINQKHLNELSADVSNTMMTVFAKVKLLIIDEISMVGQCTLNMIDQRLRHIFNPEKIFGGISVMACGDFFQLKPVLAKSVYSRSDHNPYHEIFCKNLWDNFEVFELTQIMRQKDANFQVALNNLAKGELTEEDISLFNGRVYSETPTSVNMNDAIHLFPRVADVEAWNNEAINQLPGFQVEHIAVDIIGGNGSKMEKRQLLYSLKKCKTSETMGIPETILLKINGRYMMTYNYDTTDGLCNGATGTLMEIDFEASGKPKRLWIHFDDARVGTKRRNRFKHLIRKLNYHLVWTPIEMEPVKIRTKKNSSLYVLRRQFPFVLAYAMTIHKSQGKSMKKVIVHLSKYIRRDALYVACSRAVSLDGLYLIGQFVPPKKLPQNCELSTEMQRWKLCSLIPKFRFLREEFHGLQIIYHNIQSMPKHWNLLTGDNAFLKSHIIALGETWTLPFDNYKLNSHNIYERIDASNLQRKPGGVCLLTHNVMSNLIRDSGTLSLPIGDVVLQACWIAIFDILFIAVYVNPTPSLKHFEKLFSIIKKQAYEKVIVMGDFNLDLQDEKRTKKILAMASCIGLKIQNGNYVTTEKGSSLNWILSNFAVRNGAYCSFFSYHDPIWIRISA